MKNGDLHDDDNDNDGEMKGAGSQQWVWGLDDQEGGGVNE